MSDERSQGRERRGPQRDESLEGREREERESRERREREELRDQESEAAPSD